MHVTLYEFFNLSPEDQAKVTSLDLSVADEEDLWRLRHWGECGPDEEYAGEAKDRRHR